MLHPAFYKTMISYLLTLGQLMDAPFQVNPDYPAYFALFTASPTDATMATTEATYAGYARARSVRHPYHWVQHDGPPAWCGNYNQISFPAATGGAGQIITHWAFLYLAADGVTESIVVSGPLENPLTVALGQEILFPADSLVVQSPA